MQKHLFLSASFLASAVLSAPSTSPLIAAVDKRFVGGQCWMTVSQWQNADDSDTMNMALYDGSRATAGECYGHIADAQEFFCRRDLPAEITCTQPADTHEINCCYNTPNPYCFGTGNGCDVQDWYGWYRQMFCEFNC